MAAHSRVYFQVRNDVRICCQGQIEYVVFPSRFVCKLSEEVDTDKVQHGVVELHGIVIVWTYRCILP